MDKYPESVQALYDAGMEIGNHSNEHPHMAQLSEKQIMDEVNACSEKIEAVTGEAPTLFRCPYGEYNDTVIGTLESMDIAPIQWNVERSHTKENICRNEKKSEISSMGSRFDVSIGQAGIEAVMHRGNDIQDTVCLPPRVLSDIII